MSKKITKTILLIVFVVFLSINKVDAKKDESSVAKNCVYDYGDKSIVISIDASYGTASKVSGSFHGDIINWSKEVKGFSGYNYFMDNGKQCPPMIILARYTIGDNDVYFTDEDHKSDVKAYAKDKANLPGSKYDTYNLISQSDGSAAHGDSSEDTPGVTTTTNKSCACSGSSNGRKASFVYSINDNRSAERVDIKIGDKTNNEPILNWSEGYAKGSGKNSYTFLNQYSKDNSCSEYAVIKQTGTLGALYVVLSDEANLSDLKERIKLNGTNNKGTIFTLTCKETIIPDDSTKESNSNKPKPEYDDPEINSNVGNLDYSLYTYSCGRGLMTDIPSAFPKTGRFIYNFIQILVPLTLIILGSIDLVKSIAGQKEDEIKKGQQTFIKRLIGAVLIFFVFAIVKLLVSVVATDSTDILSCVDCILRFSDSCVLE